MKERYEQLLHYTNRVGIKDLLNYLDEETDFYIAPASSNYHGNVEGGLLKHSLEVFYHLKTLCQMYNSTLSLESILIISLLHDICKVNFYVKSKRNAKKLDESGNELYNSKGFPIWESVEYYKIDDKLPLGHGEKSVIILQNYIHLTQEEIFCIRWHMMSYDDSSKQYAGNLALTNALNKYPNISLVHCADLLSISHKPIEIKENVDGIFFQTHEDLLKDSY